MFNFVVVVVVVVVCFDSTLLDASSRLDASSSSSSSSLSLSCFHPYAQERKDTLHCRSRRCRRRCRPVDSTLRDVFSFLDLTRLVVLAVVVVCVLSFEDSCVKTRTVLSSSSPSLSSRLDSTLRDALSFSCLTRRVLCPCPRRRRCFLSSVFAASKVDPERDSRRRRRRRRRRLLVLSFNFVVG